ncbi:hypothetical protein [Kitasatospora sp. LaBMicrA B282]|uniref:hypothetical protein n=1 Tax=Kitasatospora sp. LaBMicrA B282 TaxID=3420949 RepID=UPI003D143A79
MEPWRGLTNGVLYVTQFGELDRAGADRIAGMIVGGGPLGDEDVAVQYERLRAALAGPDPITGAIPQPHDEAAVREFLALLLAGLDGLRPWPQRSLRRRIGRAFRRGRAD